MNKEVHTDNMNSSSANYNEKGGDSTKVFPSQQNSLVAKTLNWMIDTSEILRY